MRQGKKKASVLSGDKLHPGQRRSGPDQYRNEEYAAKNPKDIFKSLVLKPKTKLVGEVYDDSRLVDYDYVEVLKELSKVVPNLEVRGDSVPEVLNNALIDFHALGLKRWKKAELWVSKKDRCKAKAEFILPFRNTEYMAAFPLKKLSLIKKQHSWAIRYIYTVIHHLTEVNKVPKPDWNRGEEANIIDSLVLNDYDSEVEDDMQKYIATQKSESEKLEKEMKRLRLTDRGFNRWRIKRRKMPRSLRDLLETGSAIMKCTDKMWDYVFYPDSEGNPVGPSQTYRFYWCMDYDDWIYNYFSDMIDNDHSEYGSVPFYKKVGFNHKGRVFLKSDFPALLDKFLFHLWELKNRYDR